MEQILKSQLDESVNFVTDLSVGGYFESRYVRKCDDYFIIYLSSQAGCNKGCKFCHLTTTKQTSTLDATPFQFEQQARQVLCYYKAQNKPAKYVHYNFMARGEPLSNQFILKEGHEILADLGRLTSLPTKFNISTILPKTLNRTLPEIFRYVAPTIYFSLYTTNDCWRKQWLPGAMEVGEALPLLKEYQKFSKKILKIHHPFIKGENDSFPEVYDMCNMLIRHKLVCEFNLVRYNPPDDKSSESDTKTIVANLDIMRNSDAFTKVQIIPRVGFDVKASCGMFVS